MHPTCKLKPLSLATLAALAGSGPLAAQEAGETLMETVVVSVDRQQRAIEDLAVSVHSIDADMLETFKHVHVGEVLNTVPGVVFNRGNGQESLLGIRSPVLSGAGSCGSLQVAQDGIPVRGAGFCNVNQLFDTNSEQASAIEVVRGPGSVLFGVNALHGAINVISPSLGEAGGQVSLDAGPHEYRRLNFGYNAGDDESMFGAHLNVVSDDGYMNDSGFDQAKINLGHRYDSGNIRVSTVLAATDLDQETASYVVGTDAYKDDVLRKINADPDAFRDTKGFRLHSRIEGDTDNGTWMVTPYYRDLEMTFLMHFLPGTPLEENGHDSLGVQSMYSIDAGDTLSWSVGFDVEKTDGFLRQSQTGGFGPFPPGQQYDYTVDATMWSPYILATTQTSDRDQLTFGLRYENLEYDYDNRMVDGNTHDDGVTTCPGGCRYSRPSDRSDDFDNVTAQLGWIRDLNSGSQFFTNFSYAFRAPQATELYRLQVTQTVADLDSEEAESFEVGYRGGSERFSYAVSAYYVNKENVIFQDSSRTNVSDGETRHRGIEFSGIVSLTDSLSLNMTASYARHTYEADVSPGGLPVALDGLDMDTAPKLVGNFQLNWQIDRVNSLNAELVHMDEYYTDELNLNSYEGHDIVNLRYRYDPGNDWYFAARVLNIFDKKYAERADWTGFGGDRYFVGEPASVYLTVGRRL